MSRSDLYSMSPVHVWCGDPNTVGRRRLCEAGPTEESGTYDPVQPMRSDFGAGTKAVLYVPGWRSEEDSFGQYQFEGIYDQEACDAGRRGPAFPYKGNEGKIGGIVK